jgi:ribonuclease R
VLRPDQLTRILEGAPHPLGIQEILRAGGLHPGQQTEVKRVLRELVRQGEVRKEGKRFAKAGSDAPPQPKSKASPRGARTVAGILHLHPDGFGFVHPPDEDAENIFLPPEQARRALDGDRVVVAVVPGRGGRTQGRLLEVRERIRQQVVGTYVDRAGEPYVQPNDAQLPRVRVARTQLARDGDWVKVRLGVGRGLVQAGEGLFGEVTGSLGRPGEPSAEVLSIAYSRGFSDEFPSEVMDQADRVGLAVTSEEASGEGRRDLRQMPLVTIDGEDARDFDDAVYAEPQGDGWRLVVAIADVSHYVKEGAPLDGEALRRATSVYLPDRVLPMLPERLSAGICSLKPHEDRLCMVADLTIDRAGRLGRFELYPGVMRSAARCTYDEVQADLDRGGGRFKVLLELARTLGRMREGRGAIDFDIPETRILLDAAGKPLRMERRERKDAHRLIEECMLAANEAVAKYFQDRGLPSVYRFHGEPDEEKLATFSALARAHGFNLAEGRSVSSKELNAFVQKLEGHPERRALNQLLLRSMMQAVYSAKNIGHYGLAAEHYLHFTSPIRRYPDLLVHRLLKAEWARKGTQRAPGALEQETEKLEQLALDCSDRERAAMQVEREVVAFYATLLMKDRIGEEFDAVVSSVTDFGFFVELDGLFIEGLVKGETLGSEFKLDKVLHQLVFPNGRKVRVGALLRVRLVSANTARRQLDFEAVNFREGNGSAHPGFDRLRALAARTGEKSKPPPKKAERPPRSGKRPPPRKHRR